MENVMTRLKNYVEEETAVKIMDWWNKREHLLIIKSPAGTGKPLLPTHLAQTMEVALYKLEVNEFTNRKDLVKVITESLNQEAQDALVLIEECQKISNQEAFQIELLRIIEEQSFAGKPEKRVHLAVTVQTDKLEDLFIAPVLRRSSCVLS